MVETEPDDSSDQESEIEYDDESSSDDDSFDLTYTKLILLWLRLQESHVLYTTLPNVHGGHTIKTEGAAVSGRDSDK